MCLDKAFSIHVLSLTGRNTLLGWLLSYLYREVNSGKWVFITSQLIFSVFQSCCAIQKISTFVSHVMMHLSVDSLVFRGLAEQMNAEWLWCLGQVWSNFQTMLRWGPTKLRQRCWRDWASAETGFQTADSDLLGCHCEWDFQDGTSWTSISTKSNFITGNKWACFGNFNRKAKDLIFCSTKLFFLELVLSWKGWTLFIGQ